MHPNCPFLLWNSPEQNHAMQRYACHHSGTSTGKLLYLEHMQCSSRQSRHWKRSLAHIPCNSHHRRICRQRTHRRQAPSQPATLARCVAICTLLQGSCPCTERVCIWCPQKRSRYEEVVINRTIGMDNLRVGVVCTEQGATR